MVVGRQRFSNTFPLHHDERQAIRQAPVFVRARGEQTDRGPTVFSALRHHLDPWIAADSFEPNRGGIAGSGTRHSIQPLPTNGFSGDDQGSGLNQIALPGKSVMMVLIANAEQCDPKSSVGEKEGRQNQARLGVP